MNQNKLIELIKALRAAGEEWETVDAKRELVLAQVGDKAEFVKDIVAMANNQEVSYLVIGLCDGSFSDAGPFRHRHTTNDLNQILADKIDPPLAVEYREFQIGANGYALVEVSGTNPPYIVASDVISNKTDRKRTRIHKGTIYIRQKDRTVGVSRTELENLLEKKGLGQAFAAETSCARHLAFDQPDLWEYRLTVELLRSNLTEVRARLEDIHKGLIFTKSTKMTGSEFLNLTQAKCQDLISLVQILKLAVEERIPASWGPRGESGNPMEIKAAVDHIISGCEHLLDWEQEMRSIIPPSSFSHLKEMMIGWTASTLDALDCIPEQVEEILQNPSPSGTYVVPVVFSGPQNVDEMLVELERLRESPSEWIDDY